MWVAVNAPAARAGVLRLRLFPQSVARPAFPSAGPRAGVFPAGAPSPQTVADRTACTAQFAPAIERHPTPQRHFRRNSSLALKMPDVGIDANFPSQLIRHRSIDIGIDQAVVVEIHQ